MERRAYFRHPNDVQVEQGLLPPKLVGNQPPAKRLKAPRIRSVKAKPRPAAKRTN